MRYGPTFSIQYLDCSDIKKKCKHVVCWNHNKKIKQEVHLSDLQFCYIQKFLFSFWVAQISTSGLQLNSLKYQQYSVWKPLLIKPTEHSATEKSSRFCCMQTQAVKWYINMYHIVLFSLRMSDCLLGLRVGTLCSLSLFSCRPFKTDSAPLHMSLLMNFYLDSFLSGITGLRCGDCAQRSSFCATPDVNVGGSGLTHSISSFIKKTTTAGADFEF